MTDIILGAVYKDIVTGFQGVATSKTEYLFACERVNLEGQNAEKRDSVFVDAPSLKFISPPAPEVVAATPEFQAARTGGARPAPPERGASRSS